MNFSRGVLGSFSRQSCVIFTEGYTEPKDQLLSVGVRGDSQVPGGKKDQQGP